MAEKTVGIVTKSGIIKKTVRSRCKPLIMVGMKNGKEINERWNILEAYSRAKFETYANFNDTWLNDAYVHLDGKYLPTHEFASFNEGRNAQLGHGGSYVIGDSFVLISSSIREAFEKASIDNKAFREFFGDREKIFLQPYDAMIHNEKGDMLKPEHLDLTIGYVPCAKKMYVDVHHYEQVREVLDALKDKHGVEIRTTDIDDPDGFSVFPNNFFYLPSFKEGELPVIVANPYKGISERLEKDLEGKVRVVSPASPIIGLASNNGSIKCITNQVDDISLLEHLGINYRSQL